MSEQFRIPTRQACRSLRRAGIVMTRATGLACALTLANPVNPAMALEGPGLGRPISPEEIAAIDISVFPNGSGLPSGRGSVEQGRLVYETRCASCHGVKGMGASADELAGGSHGLRGEPPDKVIGTYWPYATTLFDFIQRSMPIDAPRSLSNDQVYAVTAYLLYLNDIVDTQAVLDAQSLARVRMPNREGFIRIDAD